MLLVTHSHKGRRANNGTTPTDKRRHSAPVHKFESWSDSRLAVFFFECHQTARSCEEGACRFCAKWLVWDRADHISSEGDRSLVGRAFGSSANSASRGVGDRPLSSGALTHGPSGQRQRQCQYRALFLPSRDAFTRQAQDGHVTTRPAVRATPATVSHALHAQTVHRTFD